MSKRSVDRHQSGTSAASVRAIRSRLANEDAVTDRFTVVEFGALQPDWTRTSEVPA